MTVKFLWSPSIVPEERKRIQWERIVRLELGEGEPDIAVSLSLGDEKLHWQIDTPVRAYRERIVQALRTTGKPVQ